MHLIFFPLLSYIETLKIQLLLDYYRRDRWYSHGFLPVSLDNGMASFSAPFFRFNFFRIIKKGERFARSQCVVTHMFRRFRFLIMCPISIIQFLATNVIYFCTCKGESGEKLCEWVKKFWKVYPGGSFIEQIACH